MLRNILLITWRHLRRQKIFTLINISGLAIGIAAFIIINAYARFEQGYDRMLEKDGQVYRVESRFYRGQQMTDDWATSTNGYATAMRREMPEIASAARISWYNAERVVRNGDIRFREEHVCFADSNFFQFFRYPLLKGDPARVLQDVNSVVLSKSAARKYFGDADPVGRSLDISTYSDSYHCVVTGIFDDNPPNSTMRFNMLLSWNTQPLFFRDFWYIHESYTFIKLASGVNPGTVEAKFPALAEKYKTGLSFKDLRWAIQLVPLADMHMRPAKQYEVETKGNPRAVLFLSIMSWLILTIACINTVNLATARAIDRAREVGIRKVSGARKGQLIGQFLIESVLVNGLALAVGCLLVLAAYRWLPGFLQNEQTGEGFLAAGFDRHGLAGLAMIVCSAILLTGIYPATVLAGIQPVRVLKGKWAFSRGGLLSRRIMVAFQFTAGILLMAGTCAVYRQIVYMDHAAKGVDIDQTLVLRTPVKTLEYNAKLTGFKEALAGVPGIERVTVSGSVPGRAVGKFLADRRFGTPKSEERAYESLRVDFDFIQTYRLKIVAGHPFDRSRPADSTGVVLNEAAVRQFGFPSAEAAIGQRVWLETLEKKPNEVIGVVADYHQQSMQYGYTPVVLFMDPGLSWIPMDYVSLRTTTTASGDVRAHVKTLWDRYFPESSFDAFFLDEYYDRQFRQDLQFGRIFLLFSGLAILIACMGLFGLTAYSTARRTKEIGVRKVLGASSWSIFSLLTKETAKMILACSMVAIPLSWLAVRQWLNNYAFRVELTWWQFLLPAPVLILIAVSTISWLSLRAARTNPARTLKDE